MKIAKFAIENGISRAARHFSHKLGRKVNESTVRCMKAAYQKQRTNLSENEASTSTCTVLPRSPRGRPLKIGHHDKFVREYIQKLRINGGVVNSRIVISAAKGFLLASDKTLLQQYGGPITLDKAWAKSFTKRI